MRTNNRHNYKQLNCLIKKELYEKLLNHVFKMQAETGKKVLIVDLISKYIEEGLRVE
jgi:hypothetical protein